MNLYTLNYDPATCAEMLGDVHLSVTISNVSRMLSSCLAPEQHARAMQDGIALPKPELPRSASARWVRRRAANAIWALRHAFACENERSHRWPNGDEHRNMKFLNWMADRIDKTAFVNEMLFTDLPTLRTVATMTPFVRMVPEQFCRRGSVVQCYQAFYLSCPSFLKWTNRARPLWVTGHTRVGDEGQKFELWCDDEDGKPMQIGWSDDPDAMQDAIKRHPSWTNYRATPRSAPFFA